MEYNLIYSHIIITGGARHTFHVDDCIKPGHFSKLLICLGCLTSFKVVNALEVTQMGSKISQTRKSSTTAPMSLFSIFMLFSPLKQLPSFCAKNNTHRGGEGRGINHANTLLNNLTIETWLKGEDRRESGLSWIEKKKELLIRQA